MLDEPSLRQLLDAGTFGRLVYTAQSLPAVDLVYFVLDDDALVIQLREALTPLIDGTIVAFQLDDIDIEQWRGWSVTVVGRAELMDDHATRARLSHFSFPRDAPADPMQFMRIPLTLVFGPHLVGCPDPFP
ncbi:MAG TPA: pyridoxamine 5'-phosphate oxidase family protein [Actinopolymorphaceae bacterium]|jgi:nitroimidazol reductase NimA-like FMN-containing flavoprotein (pyridoxamine 5'-phosphate oxidase superfamily)